MYYNKNIVLRVDREKVNMPVWDIETDTSNFALKI
jgi:hypothetical protein